MNRRRVGPATSASSTSTSGSTPASLASISVCMALTVSSINLIKKAGGRPLSKTAPGTPGRKAVLARVAPPPPIGGRRAAGSTARSGGAGAAVCGPSVVRFGGGPGPGAVAVHAIVAATRLQARSEHQRLTGFRVAAHHLQAAPEAEQRVVVGRRPVDGRLELRRGLLVSLGVKQRATECLAHGALVRSQIAGPRQ